MCGLCGIVGGAVDPGLIRRMTETLRHRGPDDEGFYEAAGVSLGFRRLAIIDPEGGRQPMSGETGDVRLILNGEIYNFQELRRELEGLGHRFVSRGDAEAVVHAYEQWGTDAVARLDGMFAFAIWDGRDRSLLLARDRLGKKPLWYRHDGGRLAFASEGKALREDPGLPRSIDPVALELYLAYNHVPAPRTIYQGVSKLPPAHWLRFRDGRVEVRRYWELKVDPREASVEEHAERTLEAVTRAVRKRLVADVPLGAFLSGGVDSSAVVGLMSLMTRERVKTFSVGFEEESYNELEHARAVASRFRTDHHEFVVKADAASVLEKLAWQYDEPFGDSSALPTWHLARMTARHVKVALSGDGGDEAFGGYLRHLAIAKARSIQRWPLGATAARLAAPLVVGRHRARKKQFLRSLDRPLASVYRGLVSVFGDDLRRDVLSRIDGAVAPHVEEPFGRHADAATAAGFADLVTYLPGDLLAKVDIASMAHSLEVRCPLLDPEVLSVAFAIPGRMKLKRGPKTVFKRAFRGLLPASTLGREKMGFGVPVAAWLRGPLREMMQDLVVGKRARERGLFAPAVVERMVLEHLSEVADHHDRLWLLLVFELWARRWLDTSLKS